MSFHEPGYHKPSKHFSYDGLKTLCGLEVHRRVPGPVECRVCLEGWGREMMQVINEPQEQWPYPCE